MAAVGFVAASECDAQVARWLRVTKVSVNRWRRALEAGGIAALASKGAAGARALLPEDQRRELVELVERGPTAHGQIDQRWTLSRIRGLIRERFGVDYRSSGGLHEMLSRLEVSWQVPARHAVERDEEAIAAWREETWPNIRGRPRNAARTSASRTGPAKG